ncbi:MAG: hypothetical protein JST79_12740 [Acidobacteria bacterium]|nr:hypothetical protein [Acidobacteriota bacterium]
MSSGIKEILESFSVNQLRDLAFAMGAHGVDIPKRSLGRNELLRSLENKKADVTLALFAHRIEAITPYKHLFVYSLDAGQLTFLKAKTRIEKVFPEFVGSYRDVNPQVGDMEAQVCLPDEQHDRIYLKLVHQVEMSGWVTVSRTRKELKEFRRRHPVVVTLRPKDGIVTIGFPGFTYVQGVQHEDRMAYSGIATQGTEFLKNSLNINCKPFNAKPAIDALLEEEPNEVTDVKRNVRPKKGGRFGFDAGEEGELTTSLTDFLSSEGDIPVSEAQIRDLLRRSGASDIVLVWKRLQILTRVALLQDGPEFLFIWRDSGPSSTVVDSVLQKLISYEKLVAKPGANAMRKEILASPLDQIARPALLAQRYGVSRGEVVEILNLAVSRGDFEPRFRVNTEHYWLISPIHGEAVLRNFLVQSRTITEMLLIPRFLLTSKSHSNELNRCRLLITLQAHPTI